MRKFLVILLLAVAASTVRADDEEYDPIVGGEVDFRDVENEEDLSEDDLQELGLWDDEKHCACLPWWKPPRPEKPPPNPDKGRCPKPGGYYQDPNNCRCFWQCDLAHRPYYKCCKRGQAFSQENLVCASKELVKCGNKPHPSYDCPRGNGTFPHRDCTKFWHCSNWLPYEKDCPAGLHWDRRCRRCEWPHIAKCRPGGKPPGKPTERPTQKPTPKPTRPRPTFKPQPTPPAVNPDICRRPGGYYQDRKNCSCFWQCDLAQRPYHHCCPPGLLFNEEARPGPVCDWPENVKCYDRPPKTTPRPTRPTPKPCPKPKPCPTRPPCPTCPDCPVVTCQDCPVCPTTPPPPPKPTPCDLKKICRGCREHRLKPYPGGGAQRKYVECNGGSNGRTHRIRRCSYGLLFNERRLTCDFAALLKAELKEENVKVETFDDKLRDEEDVTSIDGDVVFELEDDEQQEA